LRLLPLCRGHLFEADQPFDVLDEVGHADFKRGAGNADRADEQAHSRLLFGKDVDASENLAPKRIL
jgi:hypothetical protein